MTASLHNYAGRRVGDDGLIDLLASGQLAGCTQLTLWDNRDSCSLAVGDSYYVGDTRITIVAFK